MSHRRRLAKPLTPKGLVGSNPTPGAPVNLPPMLITRLTRMKTGRSSSSVRTSDLLRQALTQRRSSVRITPGPYLPIIGADGAFPFLVCAFLDYTGSTITGKVVEEYEVEGGDLSRIPDGRRFGEGLAISHFSANRFFGTVIYVNSRPSVWSSSITSTGRTTASSLPSSSKG